MLICSFELATIWPWFWSLTMVSIFKPLPSIFGTIDVNINSKPCLFIRFPITSVTISNSMQKEAFPVGFRFYPHSSIYWPIFPSSNTKTFILSISILNSFVYCPIFQLGHISLAFSWHDKIEFLLSNYLPHLLVGMKSWIEKRIQHVLLGINFFHSSWMILFELLNKVWNSRVLVLDSAIGELLIFHVIVLDMPWYFGKSLSHFLIWDI